MVAPYWTANLVVSLASTKEFLRLTRRLRKFSIYQPSMQELMVKAALGKLFQHPHIRIYGLARIPTIVTDDPAVYSDLINTPSTLKNITVAFLKLGKFHWQCALHRNHSHLEVATFTHTKPGIPFHQQLSIRK